MASLIKLKLKLERGSRLSAQEVRALLRGLDYLLVRQKGSHEQWVRQGRTFTLPSHERGPFLYFGCPEETGRGVRMNRTRERQKNKKTHVMEYQVNISFDPRDSIYVARVPELENCHSHGDTPEEALANVREAIELWLESAAKKKIAIPLPVARKKFSGKFILRTSPELHAVLANRALQRGKSMNELVVELLDSGLRKAG